jgi:hypothetical protein
MAAEKGRHKEKINSNEKQGLFSLHRRTQPGVHVEIPCSDIIFPPS